VLEKLRDACDGNPITERELRETLDKDGPESLRTVFEELERRGCIIRGESIGQDEGYLPTDQV
jgi:hypothetical protein